MTEAAGLPEQAAAREWLAAHRHAVDTRYRACRHGERGWSWGRMLTFGALVAAFFMFYDRPIVAITLMGVCAVLFGVTIRRHRRLRRQRMFAERELLITDESLERFGGKVVTLRDGARPADPVDPEMRLAPAIEDGPTCSMTEQEYDDLDLYTAPGHTGAAAPESQHDDPAQRSVPVGVFGLLNRTSTIIGARRLRDMLESPCLSIASIRRRQEAVRWFDDHPTERMRMMTAAAELRGKDGHLEKLIVALRGASALTWPGRARTMRWWSVPSGAAAIASCLAWFGTGTVAWFAPAVVLLLVNTILFSRVRTELRSKLDPWRNLSLVATGCVQTAQQAARDLPAEGALGVLRERFTAATADGLFATLSRRLVWVDTGGMVHALLNILFFYDLHVADAILKRVCPHRAPLMDGIAALAELEALGSLGCFAWEQPRACYPEPVEEPVIRIEGGAHPLIPPERVVCNDLALEGRKRMWIVTGSNMAGKSTFIRMVGVNVLLAQAGSAVTAERMAWTPVALISDLRARDSLSREESYFLAEVRQLRRMILAPHDEVPVFGLIDEPFRGTNSDEQVAASLAVVEHLLDASSFIILATHERALTALADGRTADNYHFTEQLDSSGMVFDYVIRPGPARTRNALRVLEREGYPADLMARARRWLTDVHRDEQAPATLRTSGRPES